LQTEKSYIQWVRRYIYFHNKQHPKDMGALDVEKYLSYLAVEQHVSASTQNQVGLHSRAGSLLPTRQRSCDQSKIKIVKKKFN